MTKVTFELLGSGLREGRPAGTELLSQGDSVSHLVLLEDGVVKLVRAEEDGTTTIVSMATAVSLLGVVALEVDGVHDVTTECVTACRVRIVSLEAFRHLRRSDPRLSDLLVQMLARERRRQNRHISLRGRRNAEERIAGLLAVCPAISIVWLPDGGARLVPLVPHRDLAGLAGVTPQHFSRLLAAWERAGMLHRSPAGWIVPAGTRLLEVIQVGAVSACAPFDDLNIGSGVA